MKLACTLIQLPSGQWLARHTSPALGTVEKTGPSREAVLTKMREELQYRVEWCPCSGASQDTVELHVEEYNKQSYPTNCIHRECDASPVRQNRPLNLG